MSFPTITLNLLLICFLLFANAFADEIDTTDYQDAILIDNGGSYRSVKIIEVIEGKKVIIENRDGVRQNVSFDRIYEITDMVHFDEVKQEFDRLFPHEKKEKKPSLWPDFIISAGIERYTDSSFLLIYPVFGYYLYDPIYFLFGAFYHSGIDDNFSLMLQIRGYFPIWSFNGYVFAEAGDYKGGLINIGAGAKYPLGRNTFITLQAGYDPGDEHSFLITTGLIF